ncbi:hypothetical protein QBC34DRAFT_429284 [Podospora aff. communis PSN243]|uniref:CID domain-containing protein n=1 Tax=Podospora aff. communis PSN243 TaxID=3040156 RepID=A0AAV9G8M7_9PEZI|nr:hypothetical protein QBC34DRAFT_429284 [Podospora aff. communis PSN243]
MYECGFIICPYGDTILTLNGLCGTQPSLCKENEANRDAVPRLRDDEGMLLPKRARRRRRCLHANSLFHLSKTFSATFLVSGAILARASPVFKAKLDEAGPGMQRQIEVTLKMCSAEPLAFVMDCLHSSPESSILESFNLHVLFEMAAITEALSLHAPLGLRLRTYIDAFIKHNTTEDLPTILQPYWIFVSRVAKHDRMFNLSVRNVLGLWSEKQMDAQLPDIPAIAGRPERIRQKRTAAIRSVDEALRRIINELYRTQPGDYSEFCRLQPWSCFGCSEPCQLFHVGFFIKMRLNLEDERRQGILTLNKMFKTCSVWLQGRSCPTMEWHRGNKVPGHGDGEKCGYYRFYTTEHTNDPESEPWYVSTVGAADPDCEDMMDDLELCCFEDSEDKDDKAFDRD